MDCHHSTDYVHFAEFNIVKAHRNSNVVLYSFYLGKCRVRIWICVWLIRLGESGSWQSLRIRVGNLFWIENDRYYQIPKTNLASSLPFQFLVDAFVILSHIPSLDPLPPPESTCSSKDPKWIRTEWCKMTVRWQMAWGIIRPLFYKPDWDPSRL